MKYSTLFTRLLKNTTTSEEENEGGCWLWTGMVKARYPRVNIRNDENEHKQIRPNRAMLVLMEVGSETEHFWQLYKLYSLAELEADHICWQPMCVNPDHLQWLTSEDNRNRRWNGG